MKEIDNLRYLLNSVKLEISGLKNQIDEISSLCADGYFITEQKCTEAVNTLNKLIELESKVNDSFEKYVLDLPEKISAADRLIDDLEIRLLNEDKIEKLKLIKTLNPVYESNQYVDQYIDTPYTDKTRIKRYVDTINLIFDKNALC